MAVGRVSSSRVLMNYRLPIINPPTGQPIETQVFSEPQRYIATVN